MATNKYASSTDLSNVSPPSPRLTLSGTERLTLTGSDRLILTDSILTVYLGQPKIPLSSFTVRNGYFLLIPNRLILTGSQRMTLQGNANLITSDDGASNSRLVTSGRG